MKKKKINENLCAHIEHIGNVFTGRLSFRPKNENGNVSRISYKIYTISLPHTI